MAQVNKNEAQLAAVTAWSRYKNYEDAWNAWYGVIKGRFSRIA